MSTVTSMNGQIVASNPSGEHYRLNHETGKNEVVPRGPSTYSEHSRATNSALAPGILSTVRTKGGRFVDGESVTPDCLIKANGMEMTVAIAERWGLIRRGDSGGYVLGGSAGKAGSRSTTPATGNGIDQHTATRHALNSTTPDGEHGDDTATTPEQGEGEKMTYEQATERIAELHKEAGNSASRVVTEMTSRHGTGELSPEALSMVARQMGTAPEEVAAQVEEVRSLYEAQASTAVERSSGMDPDEVFAWAWEHRPADMQNAMREQVYGRGSTASYEAMARDFLMHLDQIDPQRILEAEPGEGVEVFRNSTGNITVKTPYGVMPWRLAVQRGIIAPHVVR